MFSMEETIYIPIAEMKLVFHSILIKNNFSETTAAACADIFTANSIDGVYTHAVNRFPRFVQNAKDGHVKPGAVPSLLHSFGGIEQWDGNLGPGPLNAVQATERAMHLSQKNGIGCVALANTNHWMRGGYYGWQAAKKGFVFIGWTNTIANMPAWNAMDSKLGNNPLVVAIPFNDEAIVLDMAMSQFSYGSMEQAVIKGEHLPVSGGYDKEGNLTTNPAEILASNRPIAIGYWKGAGLSLLLDILATILSSGLSTKEISKQRSEHALSQVFIAIDITKLSNYSSISSLINNIILDYQQSIPTDNSKNIKYPGERVLETRKKNSLQGIPVLKSIWQGIQNL